MKKLFIFFLLFSITSFVHSQITFNQLYENARGHYVQQTSDNGYIVTGAKLVNDSSLIMVIKTDEYGNILWSKDYGYGVGNYIEQLLDDGGYFVAGYLGDYDKAIWFKTDNAGEIVWSKSSPFTYQDRAYSAKKTSDGGYIIVGYILQSPPTGNTLIIKTNEDGDTLWTKIYGGQYGSSARSVQETDDGGYIIAGVQSWEYPYPSGYIMKTDNNGDSLWVSYGWIGFHSVKQIEDGEYVVSGNSLAYGGAAYVILQRFDANGEALWGYQYDPNGEIHFSYNSEVQQTDDGGFIVAGTGACLIKTNSDGDSLWMNYYNNEGCYDGRSVQITSDGGYIITGGGANKSLFLLKTDGNGLITWANEITLNEVLRVYPNPFSTSTTVEYELTKPSTVQLTIYDYLGRQVEVIEKTQAQGKQQIIWNAEGLPVGFYFCVIKTNQGIQTTKLIKL